MFTCCNSKQYPLNMWLKLGTVVVTKNKHNLTLLQYEWPRYVSAGIIALFSRAWEIPVQNSQNCNFRNKRLTNDN